MDSYSYILLVKAHVGQNLTLPDRFLLCANIPTSSNRFLLCAKPAPEHKSIKYPLRDSRIVRYDSGIGGQFRSSHFAQVQFQNRTDSHFVLNINTTDLPCLTLVLPGHTSDIRNSSLIYTYLGLIQLLASFFTHLVVTSIEKVQSCHDIKYCIIAGPRIY